MSYCKGCDDKDLRIRQLEGMLERMSRSKAELSRLSAVGSQLTGRLGEVINFPVTVKNLYGPLGEKTRHYLKSE